MISVGRLSTGGVTVLSVSKVEQALAPAAEGDNFQAHLREMGVDWTRGPGASPNSKCK